MLRLFLGRFCLGLLACAVMMLGAWASAPAEELTILYSGSTHAMLYPCNCPKEPDGGIARRMSLVRKIRKERPACLLVDTGAFFAGGVQDEYTQNTQLDMQRSAVNLAAMVAMQYDAVALSADEFNFGGEFLDQRVSAAPLGFLSCNIEGFRRQAPVTPFLIKETAGLRVGFIGVAGLAVSRKAVGLRFLEPRAALRKAVADARSQGADLIVVLGQLSEEEESLLAREVPGIDVFITGSSHLKAEPSLKIGAAIVARASWQGRRLGKLTLVIKDKRIVQYDVQELRLSSSVPDDPAAAAILPRCFSDLQCSREGSTGTCIGAGSREARCSFGKASAVRLLVVAPKACIGCSHERVVGLLKSAFPGLSAQYLNYPGARADRLQKDLALTSLPAYLLGREAEQEQGFDALRAHLEQRGDYYLVKPSLGGMSFLPTRQRQGGRLDLFISLFGKNTAEVLENIRSFSPGIHFLVAEDQDGSFSAAGGLREVEECLRSVCVQKYYPERFFDYLVCRSKNSESTWWEDCLVGVPAEAIRSCSRGSEGISLLRQNIRLTRELAVMFGPTYLWNNQDIFSSQGAPTPEEFRRIFSKR